MQLLAARLTVQNQRVQATLHDYETARAALQELTTGIADMTQQLQSLTEASERNENAQRKREIEDMVSAVKTQLASLSGREPQLRAREAELAGAVAAEQNQWLLLNQRQDEIERSLPR